MTNRRSIVGLLLLLVLLLAAHIFLSWRGGVVASFVPRTMLLELDVAAASQLTLHRAAGAEVSLSKDAAWRLVKPYAAPADSERVMRVLDALASTEIIERIRDGELVKLGHSREDLGLTHPSLSVSVASDDQSAEIAFGSRTPSGDGVYAAVRGEDAVYVVPARLLDFVDQRVEGFRPRDFFTANVGEVRSVDIRRSAGSFLRFVRTGDRWRLVHPYEAAASDRVDALVSHVLETRAKSFVWPTGEADEPMTVSSALLATYGLDTAQAVTVTLKGAFGEDCPLVLGREAGEGLVYALTPHAESVVTVDAALRAEALSDVSLFTDLRLFPSALKEITALTFVWQDTTYQLTRREAGEWVLDTPVAAPTDSARVAALLEKILSLTTEQLSTDAADETMSLSLTADTSYTVTNLLASRVFDAFRPEDLRSAEILRVQSEDVRRIVVSSFGDAKPTAIVPGRDRGVWCVESSGTAGGVVRADAVERLVAALAPLKAEWIVKLKVSSADLRDYGLERPRFTLAVDQNRDDAVRRNILIGDAAQGGAFATLGASDAVFVLGDATVAALTAPLVEEEKNLEKENLKGNETK